MDGEHFDRLAQRFAAATSRRSFLKGMAGSVLAAGLGTLRPDTSNAASCKSTGQICREHANCCAGLCGPKDRTGRRMCACPSGTSDCKGQCVNPKTVFQNDPANCGACGTKCPRTKCQIGVCVNGTCGYAPDPNMVGGSCDDGNRCTTGDTCQADGSCAGTPVTCPAPDQCHTTGVCDPQTGQCSNPAAPNGTPCDDGDLCTQTDTCRDGTCVGATCNRQTGVCESAG